MKEFYRQMPSFQRRNGITRDWCPQFAPAVGQPPRTAYQPIAHPSARPSDPAHMTCQRVVAECVAKHRRLRGELMRAQPLSTWRSVGYTWHGSGSSGCSTHVSVRVEPDDLPAPKDKAVVLGGGHHLVAHATQLLQHLLRHA